MMNRLRTALVSVAAVAVAMMVLGSDARAGSVSTASPQNYLSFLERLAQGEIQNGTSLMRGLSSLERTMNILENILKDTRHPSRGLVQRITTEEKTIYNQELMDFSNIQKNTNALLATEADLRALPPKEQLQVSNLLKSMQRLVVAERGVATPVR
ncbi:MAG: hypothetical protein ABSH35_16800 [Isosphaeraceae bacterium]|jgi:hypothetical protein